MGRIALFFLIFINSFGIYSQEIVWEKSIKIQDTVSIKGRSLEIENDSNIYICGGASFPNAEMGYSSSFISKLDMIGNVKWYHIFKKTKPIWPEIVYTHDGIPIFVGYYVFSWYGGIFAGFVPYLSKFDISGDLLFENCDSTNLEYVGKFQGSRIHINTFNEIIITSHHKKEDTLLIAKYDTDGYFMTGKRIDTARKKDVRIYPTKIISDKEKYYITGVDAQPNNLLPSTGEPFLLVLNKNFDKIVKKYFLTNNENERAMDIAVNGDDELVLLNRLSIFNDTTSTKNILRRINTDYQIVDEISFGESKNDIMTGLYIDSNNDILCYGYKLGIEGKNVDSFRIIKYSKFLEKIWEKTWCNFDGLRRSINDIKIVNNNEIIVLGTESGSIYLAKINDLTVGVQNLLLKSDISISPNPATDYIEISVGAQRAVPEDIVIYDLLGVVVNSGIDTPSAPSRGGERIRIYVTYLASGVYFVRVGDVIRNFVKM